MPESTETKFTPPYTSFKTLLNLMDRMAEEGVPARVDRSYLSNMPGSSQTFLMAGMRTLGLLADDHRPTSTLVGMVESPQSRPNAIAEIVVTYYADALELGQNATQAQLEDVFRDYGVSGSTMRKAIAFFLAAASYANVSVSPHFRTPKVKRPMRLPKRPDNSKGTPAKESEDDREPDADGTTDFKEKYINFLIQKAEAEDSTDPKLLDRIERVIGIASSPETSPPNAGGGDDDS